MLCELIRHKNAIVTREMFYRTIWQYDFTPATNIVESYIRRVRAQLTAGGESDPIETIRGVGYMMVDDPTVRH